MPYQDSRTLEEVYHSAVSGLYARIRSYYDFIYQRFGDEGIKLIAEMSRQYGLDVAQRAKARIKSQDLDSVADFLIRVFDTVGRRPGYEPIVERGPHKVSMKMKNCPLHFDNTEMCLAHTTMEKTLVEELNPGLIYRVEKSIPAGDPYCEHVLEIKSKA